MFVVLVFFSAKFLQRFAFQSHRGAAGQRVQWSRPADYAFSERQRAGLPAGWGSQWTDGAEVRLSEQ